MHFDPFFKILGPRQQRQSATCATERQKASSALFLTQSFLSHPLLDMPIYSFSSKTLLDAAIYWFFPILEFFCLLKVATTTLARPEVTSPISDFHKVAVLHHFLSFLRVNLAWNNWCNATDKNSN